MSSIPESLVAHHCGMTVLAFCLVTNQCSLDISSHTSAAPNHQVTYSMPYGIQVTLMTNVFIQEVLDAAEMKKHDLKKFVSVLVEKIDNNRDDIIQENTDLEKKINGTVEKVLH